METEHVVTLVTGSGRFFTGIVGGTSLENAAENAEPLINEVMIQMTEENKQESFVVHITKAIPGKLSE